MSCATPRTIISGPGRVSRGVAHGPSTPWTPSRSERDYQVLSTWAEDLEHAVARIMALDELEVIRAELGQLAGRLAAARGQLAGGDDRSGRFAAAGGRGPRGAGHGGVGEPALLDPLTRREIEVIRLMATGDSNAAIARRLVISEGTVKSHVKQILRKLGVANRAEAVARWLRLTPPGAGGVGFAAPPDARLTRREIEVIRLMATGDSNAAIARRLVISEGTVKSHVKHILRKLGAANRAEAVACWLCVLAHTHPFFDAATGHAQTTRGHAHARVPAGAITSVGPPDWLP